MNKEVLNKDVQTFIKQNLNEDITKLILKGIPFTKIGIQEIVEQIVSKNKCKIKLPTWYHRDKIYYPNKLNIEQTSSEITAKYKADLVDGKSLIDITGGFGVDCFYFSKIIQKVTHYELNIKLSQIVNHNYEILEIDNIATHAIDGLHFLNETNEKFDWIYIDPSRRNVDDHKVFQLKDCNPDVVLNLDLLLKKSKNILLKLSPLIDISSTINDLKFVREVHVVAVANEVKELLFILENSYINDISIRTVNIKKDNFSTFGSVFKSKVIPTYSLPKIYLYEPNAAILKAGLFKEISNQLKVDKLHINSHLYTSNKLIDFPGRRFKIKHVINYNKKQVIKLIPEKKANITTRNFPETVTQIRKKTKIKDGGDQYLFFTTNINEKHIVLICEKV